MLTLQKAEALDHAAAEAMDRYVIVKSTIYTSGERDPRVPAPRPPDNGKLYLMAGDPRLVDVLRRFRPTVGVATPEFVQDAAIAAWNDDAHVVGLRARYAAKRAAMLAYFATRGWQVEASEATFYLWMKAPGGDDEAFAASLMRAGVVATPGSYLGAGGEGYVRWALVPTQAACEEAIRRLAAVPDTIAR